MNLKPLKACDVSVGRPLKWDLWDKKGKLLLRAGYIVSNKETLNDILCRDLYYYEIGHSNTNDVKKKSVQVSLKRKTILIVEDNELLRKIYSDFLNGHGYEVTEAKDGVEGLKEALSVKPDLILMDVNMPNMGGQECTKRISSNPDMREVPIVMLTASNEKDIIIEAIKSGAKDYIIKNGDKEFVLERITNMLNPYC